MVDPIKAIKTFGTQLFNLNKNVQNNVKDIKNLFNKLKTLSLLLKKQADRITKLENELILERNNAEKQEKYHQLELQKVEDKYKSELNLMKKDVEILLYKFKDSIRNDIQASNYKRIEPSDDSDNPD